MAKELSHTTNREYMVGGRRRVWGEEKMHIKKIDIGVVVFASSGHHGGPVVGGCGWPGQ